MISYRFKRRAFLSAVGGGIGLKVMLRNMEASAQTSTSPARLLVTHWPVGVVSGSSNALWTTPGNASAGGYGLQPFADAGLTNDMQTIRGISTNGLSLNGGGSHEGGTVVLVTGVGCGGTRTNRGEADDGYAAGPSFEQALLARVPSLKSPMGGAGYANSIADTRTDLGEVSTKCLSYGNNKVSVTQYSGGTAQQNEPLLPVLSPTSQYMNLFSGFSAAPAASDLAAAPTPADAMLTQLASKRSVLDFALEELNRLKGMGPADSRNKLQNHYDAIKGMETQLTNNINRLYPDTTTGTGGAGGNMGTGGMGGSSATGRGGSGGATGRGGTGGAAGATGRGGSGGGAGGTTGTGGTGMTAPGCKPMAPATITVPGDYTSGGHGNYDDPTRGSTNDESIHQMAGAAHLTILRTAMACDIIRVGTFQWSPGTNHVGFQGKYPGQNGIYQHHPVSHRVAGNATTGSTPDGISDPAIRYLFNIQLWYFTEHAKNIATWKTTLDGFGNPLLDYTVIPFVTEVEQLNHNRSNMPAMIFGGGKLGIQHGKMLSSSTSINAYWAAIARAFGYTENAAPFNTTPLAGIWAQP